MEEVLTHIINYLGILTIAYLSQYIDLQFPSMVLGGGINTRAYRRPRSRENSSLDTLFVYEHCNTLNGSYDVIIDCFI